MLLVTGSKGQLGTELRARLPHALYVDIEELDITDEAAVRDFVRAHEVDSIINCAAYTAVDRAEQDVELCTQVNVAGPRNLALTGARIIHVSTDYVFDGCAHRPYKATDEPQPMSVYGRTKLEGEKAVLQHASTAIIIRTAWLYSAHGANFVKTMLRLGQERDSLGVVADQIGSPTYAGDLADAIVAILPQLKEGQQGIYHFTNEGVASWYDFAVEIMQQAGLACQVKPISTEEYPTPAARPFYSVLDKSNIKSDFNITIPHWKESLISCLKQL